MRASHLNFDTSTASPGHCGGLPRRAGIGLKPEHFESLLTTCPELGFLEIHAENYMVAGGPLLHYLERLRAHYALSVHGVSLSLGGEAPPDETHLTRLVALLERFAPAAFSEHLAWCGHDGVFLNDLLPVIYDVTTLERVCRHIDCVQERLRLRILVENPATYLVCERSTLPEEEFIAEVVRRTGCGLLLDITNVHVSCTNHGRDPQTYLRGLPLHEVGEIHLAGYACDSDASGAHLLIDQHGSAVDAGVWAHYRQVIDLLGPTPTLIERDNDVPRLDRLLAESHSAERLMANASASEWRGRPWAVAP